MIGRFPLPNCDELPHALNLPRGWRMRQVRAMKRTVSELEQKTEHLQQRLQEEKQEAACNAFSSHVFDV